MTNSDLELPQILVLARAGATGRAWAAFVAASLENRNDHPQILTLKGRLLKDRARLVEGTARMELYAQSAKAYADASALNPASYPLINAAAMSLFAGRGEDTIDLANQVLELIETGAGGGETAYWHAATRAEALLLLGDPVGAEAALSEAVAYAPQAFEDHATTLRQFRLVLEHRGADSGWLDRYAPPVSLCFSGIIGIDSADETAHAAIALAVDTIAPAFGYGALAAGADIIIAEALLERGAELHLILPAIPSRFKEFSVEPFGAAWLARFDAAFEAAASVNIVEPASQMSQASVIMAAQVALGQTLDNAQRMQSGASVLRIIASGDSQRDEQFPYGVEVTTVSVDRSGNTEGAALQEGSIVAVLAVDNGADDITTFARIRDAVVALEQHRAENPDRTVALDYRVSDGTAATRDAHRGRVIRMVQAAAPGTIIMGAEAAMAFKYERPASRIEPLGDLPSHDGPTALYGIRL